MKKVHTFITIAAVVVVSAFAVQAGFSEHVLAQATQIRDGVTAVGGSGAPALGTRLQDIINLMLYILGAIAVIMIVIGGIKYTTSNGDASSVTSAKNTILYSVIGLIVAILAFAIVNFVLNSFA